MDWKRFKTDLTDHLKGLTRFIYTPDGVDPINKKLNDSKASFSSYLGSQFIQSPITLISTFLGLPNRKRGPDSEQSWLNIGRNFLGWPENSSLPVKILLPFFFVPLHLLTVPLSALRQLVRVITELLPGALLVSTATLSGHIGVSHFKTFLDIKGNGEPWKNKWTQAIGPIGAMAGCLLLLLTVTLPAATLFIVGACLTNPINIMRLPLKLIRDGWQNKNNMSIFLGLMIGAYILIIMMGIYMVLFPLALKMLTMTAVPYLISHLPAAFIHLIHTITPTLGPALLWIGKAAFWLVSRVIPYGWLGLASLVISAPKLAAVGALTGLFIATVVVGINRIMERLSIAWHQKWALQADPLPQPLTLPPLDRLKALGLLGQPVQDTKPSSAKNAELVDERHTTGQRLFIADGSSPEPVDVDPVLTEPLIPSLPDDHPTTPLLQPQS